MISPERAAAISRLRRDHAKSYYDFLRHLLLLATTVLAILVALHRDSPSDPWEALFLRAAWILLGVGILLGSAALHGEVWIAQQMLEQAVDKTREQCHTAVDYFDHTAASKREYVGASQSKWHGYAAKGCALSLMFAVVALVCYALARH